MLIEQVMTREIITIRPDDSVALVRKLFTENRFHHLLVVEGGRLQGVISDRDLLKNISPFIDKMAERPQDVATLERRVHQIMTRKPVTVTADTPVTTAAQVMLAHRVSCLPVVQDAGRPVGIVSWRDLMRALVEEKAGG